MPSSARHFFGPPVASAPWPVGLAAAVVPPAERHVTDAVAAMGAANYTLTPGSINQPIAVIHVIDVETTTVNPVANAGRSSTAFVVCGVTDAMPGAPNVAAPRVVVDAA